MSIYGQSLENVISFIQILGMRVIKYYGAFGSKILYECHRWKFLYR